MADIHGWVVKRIEPTQLPTGYLPRLLRAAIILFKLKFKLKFIFRLRFREFRFRKLRFGAWI